MNKVILIGLALVLTACGGGGGGDDGGTPDPGDPGNGATLSLLEVETGFDYSVIETSHNVFETTSPTASLRGGMSFVNSRNCGEDTGFSVRISNAANNESRNAVDRVECTIFNLRGGVWYSGTMSLEVGTNSISITVVGGQSITVTITRLIDDEPPRIFAESPANGTTDATLMRSISAKFSEAMDASTINATSVFLEDSNGTQIGGNVSYDSLERRVTISPTERFYYSTTYTVKITTDVTDRAGNALPSDHTWAFTTLSDGTPPMTLAATPIIDARCVAPDALIAARFDEPLLPGTVTPASFVLEDSLGVAVPGTVSIDGLVATYAPDSDLDAGETFTARLTPDITDLGGNSLLPDSWSFSTEYLPEGSWSPIAVPAFMSGRIEHTAVWTGSEMIIWGGIQGNTLDLNNGRYDPATDQWTPVSTVNAPNGRKRHTATWTGDKMIVWGGHVGGSGAEFSSGAIYDPATDTWTPMSSVGAPYARHDHSAVWTGTELLIWGGRQFFSGTEANGGARYDPLTDTWTTISDVNAPMARWQHRAVWNGSQMIIWGGQINDNGAISLVKEGAIYHPATDVWSALPAQNAPDPSQQSYLPSSVVWTGADMFVWSNFNDWVQDPWTEVWASVRRSEARRFGPNDQWQLVDEGCESAASGNAVWLDDRFLSWSGDYSEGYSYDEQRDAWIPVSPYPGGPTDMASVVSTSDSVIVWGGDIGSNTYSNMGYRLSYQ
jgi:hypothetical protein